MQGRASHDSHWQTDRLSPKEVCGNELHLFKCSDMHGVLHQDRKDSRLKYVVIPIILQIPFAGDVNAPYFPKRTVRLMTAHVAVTGYLDCCMKTLSSINKACATR